MALALYRRGTASDNERRRDERLRACVPRQRMSAEGGEILRRQLYKARLVDNRFPPPLNAGVWSLSFAAEIPLLGEHRAADIRETIGTRKSK